MEEDHPREVDLARTVARHLPVEHGDRCEVAIDDVADPGVAPVDDAGSLVRRPVFLEPREAALDERRAEAVAGDPLVVRPLIVDVAAQERVAGRVDGEERSLGVVGRDRVDLCQHLDRCLLQPALVGGVGVEEPVVPERVRHDVGWHETVDPLHHEEGRAEWL